MIKDRVKFTYPILGHIISYINKHYPTINFDSIVSSGAFTSIDYKTQDALDDSFLEIKIHNQKLKEFDELTIKARIEKVEPDTLNVLMEPMNHYM